MADNTPFTGKLVFSQPADGTGRLVFGDQGGSVTVPDAVAGIDAPLPGLSGELAMRVVALAGIDAPLPGLGGGVDLQWDANVDRSLRGEMRTGWQEAVPVAASMVGYWRESLALQHGVATVWQEADATSDYLQTRWQESLVLRAALRSSYQEAIPRANAQQHHWEQERRISSGIASRFQEAIRYATLQQHWWQQELRLANGGVHHWQEAAARHQRARAVWSEARPIHQAQRHHWQEARWPSAGLTVKPEPPKKPLCYDPATLGRLIFEEAWTGDGKLVFVCRRKDDGQEPGATLVVPIRRVYMTINSALLFRLDNGYAVPTTGMRLSLDWGSWTWSFSASVRGYDFAKLRADDGRPVLVRAFINGVPYDFAIEKIAPSRAFNKASFEISGRGLGAELDADWAPERAFTNTANVSALQLMGQILTENEVGIGWNLADWQPTDWVISANAFNHTGSYISALNAVATAAGAYLQPRNTEREIDVLLKYPNPHWDWHTVTPDIQIPSEVVSFEGIDIVPPSQYNRVFILGQEGGVHGQYTRAGTAGDIVAPSIVDSLTTSVEAVRQRGRAVISAGGSMVSLKLPVLAETGIIKPGKYIKYVDNGVARIGLSRSVSVDVALPTIYQTIGVETHGY